MNPTILALFQGFALVHFGSVKAQQFVLDDLFRSSLGSFPFMFRGASRDTNGASDEAAVGPLPLGLLEALGSMMGSFDTDLQVPNFNVTIGKDCVLSIDLLHIIKEDNNTSNSIRVMTNKAGEIIVEITQLKELGQYKNSSIGMLRGIGSFSQSTFAKSFKAPKDCDITSTSARATVSDGALKLKFPLALNSTNVEDLTLEKVAPDAAEDHEEKPLVVAARALAPEHKSALDSIKNFFSGSYSKPSKALQPLARDPNQPIQMVRSDEF